MLASCSKFATSYQSPPPLLQMAAKLRGSGEGVVVLSCSDPRLNPYQVLGIDPTLSKLYLKSTTKPGTAQSFSLMLTSID
jgi:carbonic anhydrase